jgi:hypothetical protein
MGFLTQGLCFTFRPYFSIPCHRVCSESVE